MDFRARQEREMFRSAVARFAREELAKHVKTMGTSEINRVIIAGQLGL